MFKVFGTVGGEIGAFGKILTGVPQLVGSRARFWGETPGIMGLLFSWDRFSVGTRVDA